MSGRSEYSRLPIVFKFTEDCTDCVFNYDYITCRLYDKDGDFSGERPDWCEAHKCTVNLVDRALLDKARAVDCYAKKK